MPTAASKPLTGILSPQSANSIPNANGARSIRLNGSPSSGWPNGAKMKESIRSTTAEWPNTRDSRSFHVKMLTWPDHRSALRAMIPSAATVETHLPTA